jgi:hypothetical protein
MTVLDAHKLKELEAENLRLKKIVAKQVLAIQGLKRKQPDKTRCCRTANSLHVVVSI